MRSSRSRFSGDVILSVNGKPLETSTELPALVANIKPGTDVTLGVWRNGRAETTKVRVAELRDDDSQDSGAPAGKGDRSEEESRLGLAVRPLTPEERSQAGTEGRVVVEEVQGAAAEAGIQPGDIILAVGNRPVRSIEEFRKAAAEAKSNVAFLVQRGDQQIYVPVRVASTR
jgi:serine protease Do